MLYFSAACYICYNHFLQDGCVAAEGCANEVAEVTTVNAGVDICLKPIDKIPLSVPYIFVYFNIP